MHAEHGVDVGIFHHAFLEHDLGAGAGLFAGLEDQLDRSLQVGFVLVQNFGGAEKHRDVRVVAAGMHPPLVPGSEGQPRRLRDRQPVHIGAQGHDLAGLAAFDQGDDAGIERVLLVRDPHRVEFRAQQRPSFGKILAQLRDLMEPASQRHKIVLKRLAFLPHIQELLSVHDIHVIKERAKDGIVPALTRYRGSNLTFFG